MAKTISKPRPIMYACHRDAAIYARYAKDLSAALDLRYRAEGIDNCVIAYRRLGNANYHFAAEVDQFVRKNIPCCVLCFDFSKFFDSLDHSYLKLQLKKLLDFDELPKD